MDYKKNTGIISWSNILLIIMLAVTVFLSYSYNTNLVREDSETSDFFSTLYSERIQSNINEAVLQAEILENYVILKNGNIAYEEIPNILALIYDKDIHIGISYAPDGIVSYTYPLEENSNFLGYNIIDDTLSEHDAKRAIETKQTTLSGPYTLSSGETGLLVRNPVFLNSNGIESFWGFIVIIIDPTDKFLQRIGILNIEEIGYEFLIESTYNENYVELVRSKDYVSTSNFSTINFDIGQSQWHITLYNSLAKPERTQNVSILTILSVITSTLLYIITRNLERTQKNIFEQSLIDSLTKTYNKKGLTYNAKHNKKWQKEGFTLFYLDLNKFKPVNDTYGHEVGDKLLFAFSSRLTAHLKDDAFIARIGGDEFVVIIPLTIDVAVREHITQRIIEISERPFFVEGHELQISTSIGCANFPDDGTFDQVMEKADKAMFKYKTINKKGR